MTAAETLPAELRRAIVQIARTPRLLVACDYDGTLAPIVPNPEQARPMNESVGALRALAGLHETTTAVISGRALRDLATLSRLPSEGHLVGSHGSELDIGFRDPAHDSARHPPPQPGPGAAGVPGPERGGGPGGQAGRHRRAPPPRRPRGRRPRPGRRA